MAEEQKKLTNIEKLFGIDSETFEKSKNILPSLVTGKKMLYDTALKVKFLEAEPQEQETPNSKYKEKSTVIKVLNLTDNLKYSMWLSSKTLRLGIAKVYESHNNSLKDISISITKTRAEYKEFGENDCYIVQEIQTV